MKMLTENPGDYSVRSHAVTGAPVRSGTCAGCGYTVREDEVSVVRYPRITLAARPIGGIFHGQCAPPLGGGWYPIGDEKP